MSKRCENFSLQFHKKTLFTRHKWQRKVLTFEKLEPGATIASFQANDYIFDEAQRVNLIINNREGKLMQAIYHTETVITKRDKLQKFYPTCCICPFCYTSPSVWTIAYVTFCLYERVSRHGGLMIIIILERLTLRPEGKIVNVVVMLFHCLAAVLLVPCENSWGNGPFPKPRPDDAIWPITAQYQTGATGSPTLWQQLSIDYVKHLDFLDFSAFWLCVTYG